MTKKRVVITGLGAITPLGNSVKEYWDGLLAGQSGIRRIRAFDTSQFPSHIAGEVVNFDPAIFMSRKEARRMSRSSQFALAAAKQAVTDAGLPATMPDPERASVVFGTAIGGLEVFIDDMKVLKEKGYTRVSPFTLPSGLPNAPAFLLAREFQCLGPNMTISTACATSTQTIGYGTELIRTGKADVVVVGGTEAILRDFAYAGFCAMRAMPTHYNDNPAAASRPFDAKREGFVFSEGAGAFVLESLEHANARATKIYAEVLGHASSADGFHIAAIDPQSRGAIRAMKWALEDADIKPSEIGYINPHGSSTPLNDSLETQAVKAVFGDHARKLAISSTKSMIGHPMGASGVLEAMACVLVLTRGIIPPTINYEHPDPECDLDYVPNEAREAQVDLTLSNSFGLGGQNACLVLKKFQE